MFKKLKALFVVEDEGDKKKDAKTKNETTKQEGSSTGSAEISVDMEATIPIPTNLEGKPDPKFVDILLKAIEKNNMEGFDYLEYKQSLQSLQGMDMDESTMFKSAFAMAKTMGATPTKLMSSASH